MLVKILSLMLVFLTEYAVSQDYFRPTLNPGPYKVGFKAGIHFDLGRPPLVEQFAAYRMGRAVHVSIWYPAKPKNNHPKMMWSEYVDEVSRMVNPQDVTKKTRTQSIHSMNHLLSQLGGDSLILKKHLPVMLQSNTSAYRNASFHGGTFPIVVYPESPHLNNILSEYLASHGYIVVSVSRHGTSNTDFEWQTVRGIETLVQDCQFALAVTKKEFNLIDDNLAVMGTGMNASAGLAWLMRNPSVDVLVSLEGGIITGYEYGLIQKSPYFDITRADKPMLVMHSPHESVHPELIDHYKYADRFMVDLPAMREFYYLNFGVWEKSMVGILGPAPGDTKLGFEWMAQYTMYFLDWKLRGGDFGRTFYENNPQHGISIDILNYSFKPALEIPPTKDELLEIKREEGFDAMLNEVAKVQNSDSTAFSFETFFTLGQALIASKEYAEGAKWAGAFQKHFPGATSAFTIAGRCYLELGNKENAIAMYSNALKLLPSDVYLQPGDKDHLKRAIEDRLRQLSGN